MLVVLIEQTRALRVGFEQIGDVTAILRGGASMQEEDKLSTRQNPLTDESENLWKTLFNWSQAIRSGALTEVPRTRFCIVTNASGSGEHGLVHLLAKANKTKEEVETCLRLMDDVKARREQKRKHPPAARPDPSGRDYVSEVMALPHGLRETIVANMSVVFLAGPSSAEHREELKQNLRITEEEDGDRILQALGGWVAQQVLELIESRQEAWLEVSAFNRELQVIRTRYTPAHVRRRLRSSRQIPRHERESVTPLSEQPFQLAMSEINFDDREVELATGHYIHHKAEILYLARTGAIITAPDPDSPPDPDIFYQRLEERWRPVYDQARDSDHQDQLAASRRLLRETTSHATNQGLRIGEILVEEPYFWTGGYHRIANREIDGVAVTWSL